MSINPAEKRKTKAPPLPREIRENEALERALIRTSMLKWKGMDETARRMGRGLGRKELLDRVALDVGKSLRQVQAALKPA